MILRLTNINHFQGDNTKSFHVITKKFAFLPSSIYLSAFISSPFYIHQYSLAIIDDPSSQDMKAFLSYYDIFLVAVEEDAEEIAYLHDPHSPISDGDGSALLPCSSPPILCISLLSFTICLFYFIGCPCVLIQQFVYFPRLCLLCVCCPFALH